MLAVLWRALALLAALVVPILLMLEPIAAALPSAWIGATIALGCALPIVLRANDQRTQALLGAALAGVAALVGPELPGLWRARAGIDSLPVHDLRAAPLPTEASDYAAVQGYLRTEWVLDEYRVEKGTRPDQNERANAVLVPLLGTEGEAIDATAGVIVIARVTPELAERGGLVTVRGKLGPVAPGVIEALFAVQGQVAGEVPARMLDSFELPTPGQVWTRVAVFVVAMLLALALLGTAVPRETSS